MSPLLFEVRDDCAILTLNRPGVLNALSRELRQVLIDRLAQIDIDPAIRVAILTGSGRAFTAGLDLDEIAASGGSVQDAVAEQDIGAAIDAFSKPLIGAINGLAVTGGFEIALACDMLVAAESARFADTHVSVGICPGWGLSQRLSRAIGIYRAKELTLSGRFLSARQAETWGLVNRVVADDVLLETALEMAEQIASNEPAYVRDLKALIDTGFRQSLGDSLAMESAKAAHDNAGVSAAEVLERAADARARGRLAAKKIST